MPKADVGGRKGGARSLERLAQALARVRRKRPPGRKSGGGSEPAPAPVDPNRPNTLSGGAAAQLQYDD